MASEYSYPAPVITVSGLHGPDRDRIVNKELETLLLHTENNSDYGYEDYGYIPQTLVDVLFSKLSSELFQSASLFPGGPEIDTGFNCWRVSPGFAEAADGLIESSEETINVAGCFHPEACAGANESPVATTPVAEIVPQSAAAPAPAKPSPPAAKTPAANNQGGKQAGKQGAKQEGQQGPAKVDPSSNTENDRAAPQVLPLQSSSTEQSNGGTPGQQFPPQPNPNPVASAQNFNEVTPDQQSPPQPGSNPASPAPNVKGGTQGQKSPLQPRPRPASVTTVHIVVQPLNPTPVVSKGPSLQTPNSVGAGENPTAKTPIPAVAPTITIGSSTLTADSGNNFVIGSQTLAPGSAAIVVSGSTLSLLPSASALIVNDIISPMTPAQTSPPLADIIGEGFNELKKEQGRNPAPSPALVISIDNQPITANSESRFIVQGQTLAAAGAAIVVAETTFSLASAASALVINGVTSILSAPVETAPSPAPVIRIGNQPIAANSASQFVVQGQTLAAGAAPIVVSGTTYSLAPAGSALVMNGRRSTLSALFEAAPSPAPVITIGNQPITANSASQFVVQGQTLAAAGAAIVVAGTTFSLAAAGSALVINGVTSALLTSVGVAATPTPVIIIGGQPVTENSASQFVVQGQTLKAGDAPIVVAGTTFSLAPSNSALVVNGVTSELPESKTVLSPIPTLTINDQVVTADSQGRFSIGSQVLSPGGSPITISGSTYSLAPSDTAIVINGVTSALTNPQAVVSPIPALTLAGQIITANSQSNYVIDDQTLSPGGSPITISGTIYSLATYNSAIVVNDITTPLQAAGSGSPRVANFVSAISELVIAGQTAIAGGAPITISGVSISLLLSGNEVIIEGRTEIVSSGSTPVLTIGSQTFTATKNKEYVIGGQTLTPGAAATVFGVRISLASDGSDVVVQGTTIDLSTATATASTTSQSGAVVAVYTGDGRRVQSEMKVAMGLLLFVSCLLMIMIMN